MCRQHTIFVSFLWETSVFDYLTGNLDCLLPFLNTITNWRSKLFCPICLFGLSKYNYSNNKGNLLDLVYLEVKISCMIFWEFKILHKKYFCRRCKKRSSNYFYDTFSSCRGLVKSTIKWDELNWLKSIDNNIKTIRSIFGNVCRHSGKR